MIHNVEDDNVHFQNTLQMADALEKAGKQFFMLVYPQKIAWRHRPGAYSSFWKKPHVLRRAT